MPFSNPVVGGTTLVREAIRSANYVPGVSGWSINRDGSVEFATGTFRGPVIIVDPLTGNVLASIGATGVGSFQSIAVTNDILIGAVSLADFISKGGRGLVASITVTGALPATGNNVFTNTAWIEFQATAGRMYRIATIPFEVINPGGPVGVDQVRAQLIFSSPNGGATGVRYDARDDVDEQQTIQPSVVFQSTVTAVQRVQLALLGVGVVMTIPNTNNYFTMTVEDIGSFAGAGHIGGSGTAAGTSQFTKQYVCTESRSYQSNNNPSPSPDGDNNLYMGQLTGRSFGSECGLWIFPGATIRADLTGATVQSARLFMYCFDCNDTGGDLRMSWRTNSSLPATDPGVGIGDLQVFNGWPVPGWGSVDILGAQLNRILVDNANSIRVGIGVFEDPTAWRGFGFGVGFRPYIEITYTK